VEQLKGRLEFSEIQEFALQESLSSEKERPARARGGPTRCRLNSTRSVVSGGGTAKPLSKVIWRFAPGVKCAERTRDQTSAGLLGVGGQVARFDRKRPRGDSRRLQSLPLGRPLRYRLREVQEHDDPTGRSQEAFTERWRGVELLPAPEGIARRLYKWDTGRRLPNDCARRRLRRGLDRGVRPSSRSPRAPCCSRIPVREMGRPKTTLWTRVRLRARRTGSR
jgi:hypothetical protein